MLGEIVSYHPVRLRLWYPLLLLLQLLLLPLLLLLLLWLLCL